MNTERRRWWRKAAFGAVCGGLATGGWYGYHWATASPPEAVQAQVPAPEGTWTRSSSPPMPTVAEIGRGAEPPATIVPAGAALPAIPPVPDAQPIVHTTPTTPPVVVPPAPLPIPPAPAAIPPFPAPGAPEPVAVPRVPDTGLVPLDKSKLPEIPVVPAASELPLIPPIGMLPPVNTTLPPNLVPPATPTAPTPPAPLPLPAPTPVMPTLPLPAPPMPDLLPKSPTTPVPQPVDLTPPTPPAKPLQPVPTVPPLKPDSGLQPVNPGNTLNPTTVPTVPVPKPIEVPAPQPIEPPIAPPAGTGRETPGTPVDRPRPPHPALDPTDKYTFPIPGSAPVVPAPRDPTMLSFKQSAAVAIISGAFLAAEQAKSAAIPPLPPVGNPDVPARPVNADKVDPEQLKKDLEEANKKIATLEKQIAALTDLLKGKRDELGLPIPTEPGAVEEIKRLKDRIAALETELKSVKSQSLRPVVTPDPKANKGTVRVVNEYPVEVSIVINDKSYRVAPNTKIEVDVPAGDFSYQLLTSGAAATRSLIKEKETVTLRIK